jgi:hypothetical protein
LGYTFLVVGACIYAGKYPNEHTRIPIFLYIN